MLCGISPSCWLSWAPGGLEAQQALRISACSAARLGFASKFLAPKLGGP